MWVIFDIYMLIALYEQHKNHQTPRGFEANTCSK